MRNLRGATLFTGFDGAGLGMEAAGVEMRWGIEKDGDIADVANQNLRNRVEIQDILSASPTDFPKMDVLHASPPCPNFSTANSNRGETPLDIMLASKICEFISVHQPVIFTLENVWGYRNSESWHRVERTLNLQGYWFDIAHVNAADFGVPQTRTRMIIRALRGRMVPHLPQAEPWIGWYAAIEDLIPSLPDSKFAPWQLARLPEDIQTYLVGNDRNGDLRDRLNVSTADDPAFTVTVSNGPKLRAFLCAGSKTQNGKQIILRDEDQPATTVVASGDKLITRAFLIGGNGNTNFDEAYPGKGIRSEKEPCQTISAGDGSYKPRAFVIGNGTRSNPILEDEPADTVTANSNQTGVKAFLVDGQNLRPDDRLTIRADDQPTITITGTVKKGMARAWLSSGRVVSLTPRALARLQTFPDSYLLPEKNGLACKGIGNACPPLLFEKIYRQLIEAVS